MTSIVEGRRAARHRVDPRESGPSVPTPWKLRIAVGVPSNGEWKSSFGYCLTQMIGFFERSHVQVPEDVRPEVVLISIDGHLPDVRHRIAAEAAVERCTHLLWLDSDMIFPPDTLHRLLRHNLPIVGANYARRVYPHVPTAHYLDRGADGVVWSDGKTGTEIVKHVGCGVCLMDIRVFDAVEPPYFAFVADAKTGLVTRGEDVYFCEKLAAAGIPTHVDHDLSQEIGHEGEMVFTMEHARIARKAKAEEDAIKAAEKAAIVTEAEAAAAAIAPDLENAAVEGADIPAGISAPVAEAAE